MEQVSSLIVLLGARPAAKEAFVIFAGDCKRKSKEHVQGTKSSGGFTGL